MTTMLQQLRSDFLLTGNRCTSYIQATLAIPTTFRDYVKSTAVKPEATQPDFRQIMEARKVVYVKKIP